MKIDSYTIVKRVIVSFWALFLAVVIGILAMGLTGCVTKPSDSKIQGVLNAVLPDGFVGTAHVKHSNNYFNLRFEASFTGLQQVNGVWRWRGVDYNGNSPWTSTNVDLTPEKGPETVTVSRLIPSP